LSPSASRPDVGMESFSASAQSRKVARRMQISVLMVSSTASFSMMAFRTIIEKTLANFSDHTNLII
jgi:hypothetical protein